MENQGFFENMKKGFEYGKMQGLKRKEESLNQQIEEEPQMPYQSYNWILFKCFDVCIANMNEKTLDRTEVACVNECATNLKDLPHSF